MALIEKIVSAIKKFLNKKQTNKLLEHSKQNDSENIKKEFIESLKQNHCDNKEKDVETLICYGDGLGIKPRMKY